MTGVCYALNVHVKTSLTLFIINGVRSSVLMNSEYDRCSSMEPTGSCLILSCVNAVFMRSQSEIDPRNQVTD